MTLAHIQNSANSHPVDKDANGGFTLGQVVGGPPRKRVTKRFRTVTRRQTDGAVLSGSARFPPMSQSVVICRQSVKPDEGDS